MIGLLSSLVSMACDSTSIKGSLSLIGNYSFGNYNFYTIGSKSDIRYKIGNSIFELSTSYKYTKNGIIKDVNLPSKDSFYLKEKEFYNVVSYAHSKHRLKFIAFSEQERSFLRKIDLRYDIGAGLGYKIINDKKIYFEISGVILPESNTYTVKSDDILSLRFSTRLKFICEAKPFRFSNIILYQPSLWNSKNVDNSLNLNIRNTTTCDASIYKSISIGLSNDFVLQSYVHYIFPNKRSYDNTFTFYIKYCF